MAVSTVAPIPKSQPDVSKLNTFSGYIVNVTKHLAPRGTVGTTVVSAQSMTKEQVLNLSMGLQLREGPGYYHFKVTDAGGLGEDEWFTKLGADLPQEVSMAGPGSPLPPGSAPPPTGEGVTALGHGFFYNEILGTLTTPWRTVHNWKPGEPMPEAPSNAAGSTRLSLVPPGATPWNFPQQPSAWGGYPVDDSRTKQLEQQVVEQQRRIDEDRHARAEEKRDREMAEMRAEQQRQRDEDRRRSDDMFKQFQLTIEKLTARPSGPSEETQALKRELEETKRRQEEREREDRIRGEMQESNRRFEAMVTEMRANKSDPMMTMMMQFMQQMNQSSMESVKAIQSATSSQTAASERQLGALVEQLRSSQITPMQIMDIIAKSKGEGTEMARMMLDATKDTMGLQKAVYEQLLDASSQGGRPAWLEAVQMAADKVGSIGEALAARSRMQQQQMEMQQRQQQRQPQQPGQRPAANGAVAQAPQAQQLPQPVQTQPQPQAQPRRGKSKKAQQQPEAASAPATTTLPPPPPDGSGYTLEQIAEAPEADIRASVQPLTDEQFFGELLLPFIKITRDQAKTGMKPVDVAAKLLENREQLAQTFGNDLRLMPPAVQLLMAAQITVLVERCLPESPKKYRQEVVEVIEETLEAEAGEEDEEEEEETESDE